MELRFRRRKQRSPTRAPLPVSPERPKPEPPVITDLANFLRGTRMLLPTAVVALCAMAFVAFLYFAKPFFMPVVLALMISFLLRPVVKFLARLHISELIGSVLVILAFFSVLGFGGAKLIQPATEWAAEAPEHLRKVEDKLHDFVTSAAQLSKAAERAERIGEPAGSEPVTRVEVRQNNFRGAVLGYASSFVTAAIETIVLVFFFLAMGDMFTRKLVKILPTVQDKIKAVEITGELQHNISTFLFTITCINATLGLSVGLAAKLLGIPNAMLWGVMAALLNFIPYFGPWTGMILFGLVGIVTFDTLPQAILPPLIYLTLHAVESNVLTPMILGRRLTMNPVVIFLALMFWMWLWGIVGALLSIPLLMMFKVLCDHFKPLAPIGEFISGTDMDARPLAKIVSSPKPL